MRTAVVALGGNALTREGESGTYEEQWRNARDMARAVAGIIDAGYRVVLIHGNGPQVGNLAIQQEEGTDLVPAQPLFALGAMTQGQIGHILALAFANVSGGSLRVASMVTHTEVDPSDPAFAEPTKPIGPFFSRQRGLQLAEQRGWVVKPDSRRGFRRVVPSPEPKGILEADAIRVLVRQDFVVIASGGGGIPVVRRGRRLEGIEAVIDKDLTAARLACDVGAGTLVLLTGVDCVALDYGTPSERPLREITLDEAEAFSREGQFPPGSMGPKVTAAVRFLRAGGHRAIITSPRRATAALAGTDGTRIVPSRAAPGDAAGQ